MRASAGAVERHERRVHDRSGYDGILLVQARGESTWFQVHGIDVSIGGFAFYSDYALARGESLQVSIPELGVIDSIGITVRHVKPMHDGFLIGVEFDELMPAEFARVLL